MPYDYAGTVCGGSAVRLVLLSYLGDNLTVAMRSVAYFSHGLMNERQLSLGCGESLGK